ncbi:MAG: hypothetical protein JXR77_14370, partial [Lentisphaeria bacterium]|nr:hypothetical protein [Lentisphaeria bacterium]
GEEAQEDEEALSRAATGIAWEEALAVARWVSAGEGHEYRLPDSGQTTLLTAAGFSTRLALWLRDVWEAPDYALRRDLKRFGIRMAAVWDPQDRLGSGSALFGELPFARYEAMGMVVVTPCRSGIENRWNRLRAALP